jgi:hypothetical protein
MCSGQLCFLRRRILPSYALVKLYRLFKIRGGVRVASLLEWFFTVHLQYLFTISSQTSSMTCWAAPSVSLGWASPRFLRTATAKTQGVVQIGMDHIRTRLFNQLDAGHVDPMGWRLRWCARGDRGGPTGAPRASGGVAGRVVPSGVEAGGAAARGGTGSPLYGSHGPGLDGRAC